MRALALFAAVLSSLTLVPAAAIGQAGIEDAVRQTIIDQYAFARENHRQAEGRISRDGSVVFRSSGGLLQQMPTDPPTRDFVFNTQTPKHITVIPLNADAAVVHMYIEGGSQIVGQAPIPNYLVRATLIMVREGGEWKQRAAHWSPIQGGTGTNEPAVSPPA